jgi:hypothetical protein
MKKHDGLIDSFADLRAKQWYSGPDVVSLDRHGRRLYFRSADLAARLCLNGEAMREFDARNFEGSCMLVHAERYLADRLAYELGPWPKGMLKVEPEDAYALPARTQPKVSA